MPEWKTRYPGVEGLNVAVMGCIVNGPGESKHADIGISLPGTGEAPAAPVFIDGKKAVTLARPDSGGGFPEDRDRLHRAALRHRRRGTNGGGVASSDAPCAASPRAGHSSTNASSRSSGSDFLRCLSALALVKGQGPFAVIVPLAMIGFGYFLMQKLVFDLVDEVRDDGDALVVKNRGQEQRVAFADIKNVNYSPFVNPPRVTLSLRRPTVFGEQNNLLRTGPPRAVFPKPGHCRSDRAHRPRAPVSGEAWVGLPAKAGRLILS